LISDYLLGPSIHVTGKLADLNFTTVLLPHPEGAVHKLLDWRCLVYSYYLQIQIIGKRVSAALFLKHHPRNQNQRIIPTATERFQFSSLQSRKTAKKRKDIPLILAHPARPLDPHNSK
jgi:hypothetical protein